MITRPKLTSYLITTFLCCGFAASILHAEKVKILVAANFAESLQPLTERYPELELVPFRTSEEALKEITDAVALVGLSAADPAGEFVKAGKKLKWMAHGSAGVEETLADPVVRNADIVLTNMKIVQGPQIADHAMALLLNFTRDLKHFNAQIQENGKSGLFTIRGATPLKPTKIPGTPSPSSAKEMKNQSGAWKS